MAGMANQSQHSFFQSLRVVSLYQHSPQAVTSDGLGHMIELKGSQTKLFSGSSDYGGTTLVECGWASGAFPVLPIPTGPW